MRQLSLKWRLSLSFVGITVLAVALLAAVLVPLLARHYEGGQQTYMEAASERAVRDLATLSWKKDSDELTAVVENLALVTQAHVRVSGPSRDLLAQSGRTSSSVVPATAGSPPSTRPAEPGQPATADSLPSPFGGGLFGGGANGSALPRSAGTIERPVMKNGRLMGYVELSEAPAYGEAALADVGKALGIAAAVAVLLAGLAGWMVSSRLSSPLQKLTLATDRMAAGDLTVRAAVNRGDEVGRLADSFNTMAAQVEETVGLQKRFVADAAHEFGTPLTALQANLELAQVRAQSSDERRVIDAALADARRLERLSSDLLRLSRLEAGEVPQGKQPVDLVGVVAGVADAVASRAEQMDIDLRLDLPADSVWTPAYRDQLEIAFGNLVDNALKFTPPGGRVTLGVAAGAGAGTATAALWVEDTGPGISVEDQARLFERFHRGSNAGGQPGSGLGLAIVKAIADLHGGAVRVSSGPGGSRFELLV